jgi:glycerophosphoryl diester phosphodiesterase
MLEMDVCVTKDGVLVVHHDSDLRRTCGVDRLVGELDTHELPLMQDEIEVHFAE